MASNLSMPGSISIGSPLPTTDSFNSTPTKYVIPAGASQKKLGSHSNGNGILKQSKENRSNVGTPGYSAVASSPMSARKSPAPGRSSLSGSKVGGEPGNTSPSLLSQIKKLEKRRDALEDEGNYLEAQEAHEQICKLKLAEEARRRDSLRQSRKSQLQTLGELYEEELVQVTSKWEQEMREFERRVEQGLVEMQERHERAIAAYRAKATSTLEDATQAKFPPSKRLLELRRAEKALARQHEYKQANDLKTAADALEKQELTERMDRVRQGIAQGEERLKERLRHELSVFEQRNSLVRATLLESRRQDEETLVQRFHNRKSDMVTATTRVEQVIDKRMEHLSPTKPIRPKAVSFSSSSFMAATE